MKNYVNWRFSFYRIPNSEGFLLNYIYLVFYNNLTYSTVLFITIQRYFYTQNLLQVQDSCTVYFVLHLEYPVSMYSIVFIIHLE